jgi:elongation factor G
MFNNAPKPIIKATIAPKTTDSLEKMSLALAMITEEDPTLRIDIDSETREIFLSGMSEQHLEFAADFLMREHDVAVSLGRPEVIYLETIRSMAIGEGKYIRQIGGSGNYGHVKIRLAPKEYGKAYQFSNDTRDGSIPAEYIQAIDQGCRDAMLHGVLTGSEMMDIEVSLYDGSHHETDSNEMAFTIAASMAFKEAARKAHPALLEPVMDVEVRGPEEFMGAVIRDLNSRRGRIEEMDTVNETVVIKAAVPLSAVLGYATHLQSFLEGRASCSIKFKQYEVAPNPPFDDDGLAAVRVK